MSTSRIFVRGLPPNISEDQFRKHFSSQHAVTDFRLIPHRRIGFVGYQTLEDAAKAVQYFNKSYIRMSRISVDIAHPINYQTSANADQRLQAPHNNSTPTEAPESSHKRKRTTLEEFPLDKSRHHDVLKAGEALSDSRRGEPHGVTQTGFTASQTPHGATKTAGQYDERRGPPPMLPGRSVEESRKGFTSTAANVVCMPAELARKVSGDPTDHLAQQDGHAAAEQPPSEVGQPPTVSDTEWLRSRTSRLLGLVEDDGDYRPQTVTSPVKHGAPASESTGLRLLNVSSDDMHIGTPVQEGQAPADNLVPAKDGYDSNDADCRLFVRNIPYTTTEDDLRRHFSLYGDLTEVHTPTTSSGSTKGFAYISYADSKSAIQAIKEFDGASFQGRLMHIIPAAAKKEKIVDEFAISKLPLKKQKHARKKAEAASSVFNWNSMYMNPDAIMSSIADRLRIPKSDIIDPTSTDSAIRQAHAETHVIQETQEFFASKGVNLEAFRGCERGDTGILVKNFPYGTSNSELKSMFEQYGQLVRLLIPPSGTIAIVEFAGASQARAAFSNLAYRRFKNSVLFLEKGPKGMFHRSSQHSPKDSEYFGVVETKISSSELLNTATDGEVVETSTLFVRNLNFSTTTKRLEEICNSLDGFMSARVKTKPDSKKPGEVLSMGFGFLEFRSKSQAQHAASTLDNYNLDGHRLLVKAAHRPIDAGEETREEDRARRTAGKHSKIIIKNLPFEITKKEVRSLFGSYGQLRSVRVPKKFDSSARGFAFAEFVTAKEAEKAIKALKHTHLLGRRLALDFATEASVDPEEELKRMQEKVGRQTHQVALQRLVGSGRQRFTVEENAMDQ